jgi:NAD(P)-dependent dehydrogenase (short-subunit alcohol dehydrogenase family)
VAAHPEFVSVLLDCLLPVARVSIADAREDLLKAAVQQIEEAGGDVIAVQTNVTDRRRVEKWVEETVSRYGRPDGAVNLAGVVGKTIGVTAVEDIDDDDWNFVLGVNLTGLMLHARAVEKNGGKRFDRQRGQCSWLDG